jgi:hypothetical protein
VGSAQRRRLPLRARIGLQQAWLEVLRKRHPGVTWVTVEPKNETEGSNDSIAAERKSNAA